MLNQPAKILTTQPTPRVNRLRDTYLGLTPRIGIDRARILTRSMKATEGEPMVIRRAKAFVSRLAQTDRAEFGETDRVSELIIHTRSGEISTASVRC